MKTLTTENPLQVLSLLLSQAGQANARTVGFFQKCSEIDGVFQPEETVIGFDPIETLVFRGENDPFQALKARTERQQTTMGYFSYDSVRFREPILNSAAGGFSQIGSELTLAEFAIFGKILTFNHRERKLSFVLQPGAEAFDFESLLESAAKLTLDPAPASNPDAELAPEDFHRSLGSEAYKAGVWKLQEHIQAGDIFQAVLSERFEIDLKVSALDIFLTLVEIGSSAYQFYFSTPKRVVFGASPELLLGVNHGKLETHPIAGTRPRGKTPEEDQKNQDELMKDTKENAEHLMLVDLARNDLGRISKPGTVKATERNLIKKFPSVMHIVSKVEGELKPEYSASDALSSCFPAGTLSGAPKIRAMQLISEIEGAPRGFYGGAFFLSRPEQAELEACISIRSMEVVGAKGFIQAGAGIVMDSKPDSEYAEVLHKSKTLRRALAIALGRRRSK